jgi:hypothetical protein
MRKLTLNPETLAVVSFSTSHETRGRGTAHAHGDTPAPGDTLAPPPADGVLGEGGPTIALPTYGGLETASCTQCDTCNGATC